MNLSNRQFHLLNRIAVQTKMDCWFSIRQGKDGNDYVYDLEEKKRISLRKGVAQLLDGISEQYMEMLDYGEVVVLLNLMVSLSI